MHGACPRLALGACARNLQQPAPPASYLVDGSFASYLAAPGKSAWRVTVSRWAAAMSTSSRLADHAFGAEVGELRVGEAELLVQHLVGVLADPWDARLGAVGHLRQLHWVAGDEHRVVDVVGARQLDEHVARLDVRIGDDVGGGVARPGRDPGGAQLVAGVELRPRRRPLLHRRTDDVLEVL